MKIEKLNEAKVNDFLDYCKKVRGEVDDSFLDDEELKKFQVNELNPTYLLHNDVSQVIGAISLIINEKENSGRFRIFHAISQQIEDYESLFQAIKKQCNMMKRFYIFIPVEKSKIIHTFKSMNFEVERYAYLLERDDIEINEPLFPKGFVLRSLKYDHDEQDFCHVRNESFKNLIGFEEMTPEMVRQMSTWNDHIDGGILLLYHQNRPVGTVRIGKERNNNEYYTHIGSLAVIPEYQGKGLGRNLLRAALKFGRSKNMPKAMLSVNSENEKAVHLYLQEGFHKVQGYVCLDYRKF